MLTCGLCGRKQAEGLLSRGLWGHAEGRDGRKVSACPPCKGNYRDWEQRLLVSVKEDATGGPRAGAVYKSDLPGFNTAP